MRFHELPKATQNVILVTVVIATAAGSSTLAYVHQFSITPFQLALCCAMCSALELLQIELTAEKSRMSLSFAGLLGVVMMFGPATGALVGLVEGATGNFVRHDPQTHRRHFAMPDAKKLVFNTFNHSLSASMAGLVYVWAGGTVGWVNQNAIVPALLATMAYFQVNTWGTAAVVATSKQLDIVEVWHENFLWTAPQSLMSYSAVLVGLWIYSAMQTAWIVFLVIPPVWVVYYSYRLYMDKIRHDLDHISALNTLNNSIITSLATAIDAKDHYTNKHLSRVQCYALAISDHLGLCAAEREAVRCAALVHDIGKLGVPEHILTKPGKLTPAEFDRMKQHVAIGAAILRPVNFPWPVVDVVLGHHERWDGLGYPNGLKGEEIPIGARVIALADVFDALTSDRPYRKAMAHEEAYSYICKHSGTHFDPRVVEALVSVMELCERQMAELGDGEPEGLGDVTIHHKISDEVMEQIARANSEFFAMYDPSQNVRGTFSLDASMQAVIEKVQKLVPFDTCAIFLEHSDAELRVEAVSGMYSDLLFGMKVEIGEGLAGRVFRDLEPVVNAPASHDVGRKVPYTQTLELNSSLVVPLRANGKTLGALAVYHSSYNIYTSDHARLLVLVAEHTANTVEAARRLQNSQDLGLTDLLTGLPNARMLNNWMTMRLEESRQTREAFAVVLIDLDDFALVNETLGHERGDDILREAAAAMQNCVRSADMLARYASDEFILVIPNSDPEMVRQLCHRLADSVASIGRHDHLRMGASIGCAVYPDDGLNARELIEIANAHMYADKNARKERE
jgi:diguanylate cyclase (GGDEF)-like protein/putative nucleotidyltransferase with HDIG domain